MGTFSPGPPINPDESSGAEALAEVHLSTRLSRIHLVVSVLLAIAVIVGLLWISDRHDGLARENAREMVVSKLESFGRRQRYGNADNSIWTEAYEAIGAGDTEWLYDNVGTAAMIGTVDLVVFVPRPGAEQIGWMADTPPEGSTDVLPPEIVDAMLDRLNGTDPASQTVRSAFARFGGEIWLLTVARVTHTEGVPAGVSDDALPRQIRGVRAGHLTREISEQFSLKNVNITGADLVGPEMDSVTLDLLNRDDKAALVWQPPAPGSRILRQIALPLAGMLAAFSLVALLLSRFAVRAARRLESALVEAKAADRAKTQFLSIVSHELRTPMNGIIGLGQLLQAEEMNARHRTWLTTMMGCAETQLRLIEQLLDIAQIESGKRALSASAFRPAEVLSEIAEISRLECEKRGLWFDLQDRTDPSELVVGDAQALRQIISNLVDNAIKFTKEGGVTIRAAVSRRDKAGNEYRISVTDTGIGIDQSDHARIFQHLTQLDSSATRVAGGLGLGLCICRWLSDIMGGHLHVESALGSGSAFTLTVTLPRAEALPSQLAA